MKKYKDMRLVALIFCMGIMTGCSWISDLFDKDSDSPADVCGKWEITTAGSRYSSVEFTSDGYFILAGSSVQYGKFVHAGNTITLSGGGSLVIHSLDAGSFSFSLIDSATLEGLQLDAKPVQETVAVSARTDLLCHAWRLVNRDGTAVPAGNRFDLYTLFTRTGTCLVSYGDGNIMLARWYWFDNGVAEKETVVQYSNDKGSGRSTITLLTADTMEMTDGTHSYVLSSQ